MKEKTLKTVKVRRWKFTILLILVGILTAGLFYTSYYEISNLLKNNNLQLTGLSKYINSFTISLSVAIVLVIFLFSFHKDFSHISSHIRKVRRGDFREQIDVDRIHKNSKLYNTAREFNVMSNKLNNTIKDVVNMTNSVKHHSKTLELISKEEEINGGKLNYMTEDIKLSLEAQGEYLDDAFNGLCGVYEKVDVVDESLLVMRDDVEKKIKIASAGKDSFNYLNREINSLVNLLEENISRADSLKLHIHNLKEFVENVENANEKVGILTLIANVEDDNDKQPEANKEIKALSDEIEESIKSISTTFEDIDKDLRNLHHDVKGTKDTLHSQNKRFNSINKYSYAIDEFLKYSQYNIDKNLEVLRDIVDSKEEIFAFRENIANANICITEKVENVSSISNRQLENTWKIKDYSKDLFSLSKNLKKELEEFKVK
ncbi:methyl-accepting chemotaxis protein [Anaerosalibacter bizertensis]|uniref:Methyl-accepting chemotaxis protein n=1 Tax=Anaerosalibacter bizertensis TaxID=932217 RepID=A0A9Q4AE16_9FIRM|nr:methyl-accepting chemotaxis protein [Anaerosalibacter bizertensis]MBV1818893.1 methyl-accepting chemotaxis protein [Bacteroidales bacterium MSK.15.36]MCB5559853.1 methyl-accepting chemotaxis protein [Anaerosalibacter bizertensis]MCG4565694.1 methyl-accepting chemotaxis protein [Anaerosalibacter bizertensis]MCG4582803.1 methyl-accepting chemotaxis protein [Anaerosalibacter bizertensis]MCG4585020.1 methyl-accepting chemotaxis protein [Anaerosalibacter bizertensis]